MGLEFLAVLAGAPIAAFLVWRIVDGPRRRRLRRHQWNMALQERLRSLGIPTDDDLFWQPDTREAMRRVADDPTDANYSVAADLMERDLAIRSRLN